MKVSQAEFQNMKEEIVKDMISRLMEERRLSLQQAFDVVYTSRLFEKLSNPKTGLSVFRVCVQLSDRGG